MNILKTIKRIIKNFFKGGQSVDYKHIERTKEETMLRVYQLQLNTLSL